jgi:hypothetical protein
MGLVNITLWPLRPHQERILFHTEQEALWAPELFHTIWSREKSLFAAGIQTPVLGACNPNSVPTILSQHLPKFHLLTTLIYATASPTLLPIHSSVKCKDKNSKATPILAWTGP